MKKLLLLLLYFVFFGFNQSINAQVPGYMGKKVFINADIDFSSHLHSRLYNFGSKTLRMNKDFSEEVFFTYSPEIDLNYVISKKWVGGIGLKWKTLHLSELDDFGENILDSSYRTVSNFRLLFNGKVFNNSRKGYIAPLGSYYIVSPFLDFYNIEFQDDKVDLSKMFIGLKLGFGKQIILSDFLILNYQMGVNYTHFKFNGNPLLLSISSSSDYFNDNEVERWISKISFSFKLGFGFIL